ncbi:hypothetical protein TWF191_008956 [Orbilia oligospora]|uniref:Uncharacterized protein n=1 Tax=Orbilia oligospora TaxID=2813651 RepID=A0A7C8QL91_ORBOL|nr:hypothetical protein TWF191_008956 [Orbilia oligospora]
MKFYGGLTTFIALIGLAHALPAADPVAIPADLAGLTTEDIIKLSEGYLPSNFNVRKRSGNRGCTANNVLRRLRDKRYSKSASAFCSKYIRSTITDTVLVPATITTEKTKTPPPTFVTVTDVSILTETDTSTSTFLVPTTEVPIPKIAKRSKIAYPPWLSTQYSPSRVSSACSCFIAAPCKPTRVTKTIVTGTVTAFSKTKTLPPVVSTITESVTTITTITSIVAKPKVINCKVTPACRSMSAPGIDLLTGYTILTRAIVDLDAQLYIYEPRLRTSVSKSGVFAWLGISMLLTMSGINLSAYYRWDLALRKERLLDFRKTGWLSYAGDETML